MSATNPKKTAATAQTAALYPLRFASSALATTKTACTTRMRSSSTGPRFTMPPNHLLPVTASLHVARPAVDGSAPGKRESR